MSPDNAAIVPVEDAPDFSAMSDRELLESIARDMHTVRRLAADVQGHVAPVMEKLSKNPLLRGLGF